MQPPSVTRATLASGAPLTRAVTVTAAPGRTVSVSPGPAVAVPSSLDEVRRRKVLRVRDCLRPPDRFTRRVRVAAAHHEAAVRPHPLGVGGEDAIARCVPPVNPAARRQRDRQPMPVAGGDLLTCDDLQAVVLGAAQARLAELVLWSVETMKSRPADVAAAAISVIRRLPSECTVCVCKSLRYHPVDRRNGWPGGRPKSDATMAARPGSARSRRPSPCPAG